MGLAASQARFLAITARKADCEFRSMQIAQNKLSVTRELQAATEKYQNALNAEALVWDYDGTGSDLQSVSYGLMMRPSVYNNYNPYLLTDRSGRVVVSESIAAAARKAGIDPDKGGTRSEAAFIEFMKQLGVYKAVSTHTSEQVQSILSVVKNPSNEYLGLDGLTYTSYIGCPYALPVYVDNDGNYLGAVLKDDLNIKYSYDYSDIVKNPVTTYTQSDGTDADLTLQIAVPVYVDKDGKPCLDSDGKMIGVLKENPYYDEESGLYIDVTNTDGTLKSRQIKQEYYEGEVKDAPLDAVGVDYVIWTGDTTSVGSPQAILDQAWNDANIQFLNKKLAIGIDYDFDAVRYYTGERNPQPSGSKIAYAIYTGKDKSVTLNNMLYRMQQGDDKVKLVEYSSYNKNNGYGAEPMSKNGLTGLNIRQIADKISEYYRDKNGNIIRDEHDYPQSGNITIKEIMDACDRLNLSEDKTAGFNIIKNGVQYEQSSADQVSLSDVLTGNVFIVNTQEDGNHKVDDANVTDFLKLYFETGAGKIAEALSISGDYVNNYNLALRMTEAQFFGNVRSINYTGTSVTNNIDQAKRYASTYNETVFLQNSGGSRNSTLAVNLSNVFNYFLTMMTILEDGFNSEYMVADDVANCNFVTDDPTYRFIVEEDGTETNEAIMKADFYQQLFNNLCINGYKTDKRVENDEDYLGQMLKNGSYFISSLNRDGHFYQSRYNDSENTLIKVVADEDAIAIAESEYNYMKIKLTAKEDKLDLDMKNIDMEISALTSEYESVKNLISKGIEKTFKQFES